MAGDTGASVATAASAVGTTASAPDTPQSDAKPWHKPNGRGFQNPWSSFIYHGFSDMPRLVLDMKNRPYVRTAMLSPSHSSAR